MALSRRTGVRFQASIWPGFVDAMTGLLLVLMFLLTIFMVVQFVLRETISGQESELDALSAEVSALASALGLEERRAGQLQERVGELNTTLDQTQTNLDVAQAELSSQASVIATLTAQRDRQAEALTQAQTQITAFEAQLASLLADQSKAERDIAALTADRSKLQTEQAALLSEQEALNLALAQSRSEIDSQTESARLAAAQREALEALVADLQQKGESSAQEVTSLQEKLNEEEAARLAGAAAADLLRDRLAKADTELTAMTLALEAQRKDAEDTLTLLAAAEAAQKTLDTKLNDALAKLAAEQTQAGERDELVDRLSRVLSQMQIAQAENAQAQAALEAEMTRAREQSSEKVADLQKSLATAQAEVAQTRDSLETQLAKERAQNVQTQSEFELELTRLQQENTEARRSFESQLQSQQAEFDAIQQSLNADLEQSRSLAQARASELEAELAQAEADLAAARGTMTATAQDRASVEARLLQALESLERAQVAATDQEVLQARLAAALTARQTAEATAADQSSLAEQRAALLAQARATLSEQKEISSAAQRQTALLNQQVAALRTQLGGLQALLDDYEERDVAAKIQLENLGSDLNAALARAASEERKRRMLEEAERKRLEEEALALQAAARELEEETKQLEAQAQNLERYRSEFFGRLRDVLGSQEGVRIEGDRFVFSSEVLFPPGGADLSIEGEAEIAKVAAILRSVASDIPAELDWVIRVDGHTDNIPLISTGKYSDNWELSQGRALSVVRYMVNSLGIPPERLSANGFGQYQPVNTEDSSEARAQNRRIELKLTEK